ncbi:hypothetical protein M2324_004027 [Rhodovulum sulfidophilum]|nr:hypothetical protein [Rhodovulum sulfidophilum]MCW2305600.1 hypothetical protein [Rhodovulum sulfidophilum]
MKLCIEARDGQPTFAASGANARFLGGLFCSRFNASQTKTDYQITVMMALHPRIWLKNGVMLARTAQRLPAQLWFALKRRQQ